MNDDDLDDVHDIDEEDEILLTNLSMQIVENIENISATSKDMYVGLMSVGITLITAGISMLDNQDRRINVLSSAMARSLQAVERHERKIHDSN